MSGIQIRISKLFGGKKKLVISALDHVLEYGYQKGIVNTQQAIDNCIGTDAILVPRFMLKRYWKNFAKKDSPIPVVRINWTTSFYYPLDYRQGYTTACTTVEEAVEAGAGAVICSLFLEEENNQAMERDNIKLFAEVVRQKERLGIPLIGECYVVEHKDKTENEVHEKVKRVSRIMTELGADLIKTFFTGEKFHEVVKNTPAPIFTIGADKLDTDRQVMQKAYDSVAQGARGIIFGRNIFMSENPGNLIKALNEVINDGVSIDSAMTKNGLK